MGVAVEPFCRYGAVIGVAVGGGLIVEAPHLPLSPLLLLPPRLRLMRLMSASLLVLPSSALLVLLMDCLKVDSVILIVPQLHVVVGIYVDEVPPRRLHDAAASRDTS